MSALTLIEPDWPRHPRVRAACTTRHGGVSAAPYASFNLALHVGDHAALVQENRQRLHAALELPAEPAWLNQVHGTEVVRVDAGHALACADAAWTDQPGAVLAILTADCLPVLLADDEGRCLAAAHAGWRGLAAGVIEATVQALPVNPRELSAWLGPGIGPSAFEVGDEVREVFVSLDATSSAAFQASAHGRWRCDLYAIARQRLARVGVTRVHGGTLCTASSPEQFFSFRRDGVCGRMATLLWRS